MFVVLWWSTCHRMKQDGRWQLMASIFQSLSDCCLVLSFSMFSMLKFGKIPWKKCLFFITQDTELPSFVIPIQSRHEGL